MASKPALAVLGSTEYFSFTARSLFLLFEIIDLVNYIVILMSDCLFGLQAGNASGLMSVILDRVN